MFGIGWDLLQPKDNIIALTVFIPAQKPPKIRGSFAIFPSKRSMLKAIPAKTDSGPPHRKYFESVFLNLLPSSRQYTQCVKIVFDYPIKV